MDDLDVEVFATGTWGGITWTAADLDEMARNHARLMPFVRPPLKLGHAERQVLGGQRDGQPALGWVAALRRVGDKLIATLSGIPTALHALIERGAYRRVSCEIYTAWETTTAERNIQSGVTGNVVSALALLGADIPEVKTLDDLRAFLAIEASMAFDYARHGTVAVHYDVEAAPHACGGMQSLMECSWERFQTSNDPTERCRHATALLCCSDPASVPASVRALAEPVSVPRDLPGRISLWRAVVFDEPRKEGLMTFDAEGAAAEVRRLAGQIVDRKGWPRASEDSWRRARDMVFSERPDLDPSRAEDRQVREAVRIICRDNNLNPTIGEDRRQALVMLRSYDEYAHLRPTSLTPPVPDPVPITPPAVPPIPESIAAAVAKVAEELGVSWSTEYGRHAILTCVGRRYPGLVAHLPAQYRPISSARTTASPS